MLETVPQPPQAAALPPYAVDCTLLTPSGSVIARGRALPRESQHVAEAYSVQLTDVEPCGVLEALVYADRPSVVLRAEAIAELPLRIDHITGSAQQRRFFCHVR